MLERMLWNTWRGYHNEYIARFAEIVAQGETLPAEDLVLCFLTNIPLEICDKLNQEGTRNFQDWREAAAALRESAAPYGAWRAKRLRYEQEFANTKRRLGPGGYTNALRRTPTGRGNTADENVSIRRYECTGKGHLGRDCPLRNGVTRRMGETCSNGPVRDNGGETDGGELSQRRVLLLSGGAVRVNGGEENERGGTAFGGTGNGVNECTGGHENTMDGGSIHGGLLDTGASRSFIRPAIVERLGLKVRFLQEAHSSTVANGEVILIDREVPRLSMLCGEECFTGDFLSDKLRTYVNGRLCDLPVLRREGEPIQGTQIDTEPVKTAADHAYADLAKQVARMSAEEAAALLRPPTKRYKSRHRAGGRVKIKDILREAREDTAALKQAIEGLHCVVALPAAETDRAVHVPVERQGDLLCAIVEHLKVTRFEPGAPPTKPVDTAPPPSADIDDSPWPTAKLQYTEFDAWSNGPEALRLPRQILTVLRQHRLLFPDSLPDGLPPKRPYDHRILLLPGRLPTRAPIYNMPPDQLAHHSKEIARLSAKRWIGPTYSPIRASTIMVDKRDDGSGEGKMRMVVNYQALNALTIAPEFPIPTVQTVLEMIGGAAYFPTLDLEAGFHQIRMAREDRWKTAFRSVQGLFEYKVMPFDRWKTAFRSVQGLFEYKVMPFGLNGAPATFQANINAYLQPLLCHGVIAYLDDVFIYSSTLESHVLLLQQVLGMFLKHKFYPRLSKCKLGQQELTYLGYSIGADGIKPAADKVEAILLWTDVLMNETHVRQFLGTMPQATLLAQY
ncbi:LOW QUALITY PROTEIN: uncharacterized protein EMH_0063340 [Eimeria mitis]|uniref:Reverse transcriptase domain-containing protein n=1 Tax=Eimeria mitis TaxID=44415 RepID=U6KH53_9EIME|nr:LOW QUALITY PROTEIN: uncharacterized protein EMH_0063340 [Eimeria mitis]CDJ36121.1 hypothetical protein EMH_0063340 [Eimeria mitis]